MAAFIPFDEHTALPAVGALESDTLDFKGRMNSAPDGKPDFGELAKDIAAFANAHGGVILVGAFEDRKRGVLGSYRGLTDTEAKEVREAYSRAAKDFCSPTPVNDSKVLDHPTGKIVAVNVWPFPGQAVGVRDARDSDRWTFPWRTGIDTTYLSPEQLPMLMIPELRRKIALLRSIAPNEPVTIDDGGRKIRYVVRVDEIANYVQVVNESGGSQNFERYALEQVERIWKDFQGWEMHVGPRQRR